MRPEILNPLFGDLTRLRGVGEAMQRQLARLNITKPLDLLFHWPTGRVYRTPHTILATAHPGDTIVVPITVVRHETGRSRSSPVRVVCHDDQKQPLTLVFFRHPGTVVGTKLPPHARRFVAGTLEAYQGQLQIIHPDYIVAPEEAATIPMEESVYPLTEGLSGRRLSHLIQRVLSTAPSLTEWIDPPLLAAQAWPTWHAALTQAHKGEAVARARLAYDEIFANQVALALVRQRARRRQGKAFPAPKDLPCALPFALTAAQCQAVDDVMQDLSRATPMLRLLQGDVGSGKTVVALLACAHVARYGVQSALLAPTEILARQHFATFSAIAPQLRTGVLTGREKGKTRDALMARIVSGDLDVIIGTHALLSDDVHYHNLGLLIIDEQHKFGVHQRLGLTEKAAHPPHLLVMSATPIPRSLTLTLYGELDISILAERPPGRRPIETRVVSQARLDDVYEGLARNLAQGGRVYWVCPLVEESEKSDLAAAETRAAHLQHRFGDAVALIHGRLKSAEKQAVMQAFAQGERRILVATTVVEVGVDVPEANLIVIEAAERFGLAQLHQLRGRVGRGERPSACVLLRSPTISETARARLAILRATDDGFKIAEEDLRLRGAGDILGTKQSGMPEFKIAQPAIHGDLFRCARQDARLLLDKDPTLSSPRGHATRSLLYLFDRLNAISLLGSG